MNENDPVTRFQRIYETALATVAKNPEAMTLSTVDDDGQPSSRQVLLKHIDERGFVFYTNLESRKGAEMRSNPGVSLNFYWRELDQQIVVRGRVEPVTEAEADAYFATRDRGSQLGARASRQSRPLSTRAHLLGEVAKVEARYVGRPVPRPFFWSGFRVQPFSFDFWAAGPFRLHDRIIYELKDGEWVHYRAYP